MTKNSKSLELSGPPTSRAPVTRRSSLPIVTPLYTYLQMMTDTSSWQKNSDS